MSELRDLAMSIRYDLTSAQGKLTELVRQIDALKLDEKVGLTCPHCGPFPGGPRQLAEHLYVSHGGPEPEHWTDAYLAEQAKKARKQTKEAA